MVRNQGQAGTEAETFAGIKSGNHGKATWLVLISRS